MSHQLNLEIVDADGAIRESAEAAGLDRAGFLKKGALAGGGLIAGSAMFGTFLSSAEAAISTTKRSKANDVKILNYALTLEFLEADFYDKVINSGLVKDRATVDIAKKFGATEQEHVDALKATIKKLGGKPVNAPKTKFEPTLDKGLKAVLETAATVENLGAAAYLGQAGNIKSKEVLAAALAIHSVEARHAAALNILVGRGFGDGKGGLEGALPDGAFGKPMDEAAVLAAVKPFLA